MARPISHKLKSSLERLRRKRHLGRDYSKALVCREIDLKLAGRGGLQSFRVAHITDQHFGRVTPMELQQAAISLVNSKSPDIVVLTGDFVCHSDLFLDDLSFLLSQLSAPSFAVLGNHDHWNNAAAVKKALQKAKVEVLENENTVVSIKGQQLQLVGIDDAYTHHDDVEKACKGMRTDLLTLGLSHIAEKAHELWAKGVDLVLSGHTHAGQITVARLNELLLGSIARHEFIHGLYPNPHEHHNPQYVYVGAGVGSAIMPLRIGQKAKRETTLFQLKTVDSDPR